MIPEQLYKRRRQHDNTPEWIIVIIVNYVIVPLCTQWFAMCTEIKTAFWVILAGLALYNVYTLRRNREAINRSGFIAYGVSMVVLIALFFLLRSRAGNC